MEKDPEVTDTGSLKHCPHSAENRPVSELNVETGDPGTGARLILTLQTFFAPIFGAGLY